MPFVSMPVFDPLHDKPALLNRLQQDDGLIIACYCAAWCDTCTEYRPQFDALADKWPDHAFVWIDIEESPELLDDEDVRSEAHPSELKSINRISYSGLRLKKQTN